ncbi:NUDIX domain-containing protein [Candidatus Bathyarchaeota archaeon]|jgi:8-oxo-dGTP pyrophosphatase MutT (NUDIX family)|nr:NUDIX domain-containing protein [Candidatus Bathyarchaeota archaeon]
MKRRFLTVTCIITWNDLILLLKRSSKVNVNRGLWCGVAGRIEEGMSPQDTAYREILEETRLRRTEIELLGSAPPILLQIDIQNQALVYPFLFKTYNPDIKLDWEHTEYKWIKPEMLYEFETVPQLGDIIRALSRFM